MRNFTTFLQHNYDKFIESLEQDYNRFLLLQKLKHNKTNQIIYLEICLRDYVPKLIENVLKELNEVNKNLIKENEKLALALMNNKSGQIYRLN